MRTSHGGLKCPTAGGTGVGFRVSYSEARHFQFVEVGSGDQWCNADVLG
jgi:hypothetical protein